MPLNTDRKIYRANILLIIISIMVMSFFECDLAPAEPDLDNQTDSSEWEGGTPDIPPAFDSLWVGLTGVTSTSDSLLITWAGNLPTMEFRSQLDSDAWSAWSRDTLKFFKFLDEGSHTIGIQARYVGVNAAIADTSFSFVVNAVDGPGFMLSPKYQHAHAGDTIETSLVLEEVTDLMTFLASIEYDQTKLELMSVEILEESSDFMLSGAGQLVKIVDSTQIDRIDINLGLAQADPAGVSGTGTVATLSFKTLTTGLHKLEFGANCRMIDSQLEEIAINETTVAMVEVQ